MIRRGGMVLGACGATTHCLYNGRHSITYLLNYLIHTKTRLYKVGPVFLYATRPATLTNYTLEKHHISLNYQCTKLE